MKGDGDRDLLLAMLNAKTAEDQVNYRSLLIDLTHMLTQFP
jgi:hypothetical protein